MHRPGNGPEGKLNDSQLLFFGSDHGGRTIRWTFTPALGSSDVKAVLSLLVGHTI